MSENGGGINEELQISVTPADGWQVTKMSCTYRRRLAQPNGYDSAESTFATEITLGPDADADTAAAWLTKFVKARVVAELRPVYEAWYGKKGGEK